MISGDVPHDGRGRDSHLRAAGRPRRQIGLCKKPLLMFWTSRGVQGAQGEQGGTRGRQGAPGGTTKAYQ